MKKQPPQNKTKKEKKPFSIKKKIYFWVGINLVIGGALVILIILPYQEKIINLKIQIQENRQAITEAQEKREALILSGRNYQILEDSGTEEIFNIFVNKAAVLSFINNLETLASDSNITQQIKINEEDLENNESLNLQLIINGSFINTLSYLNKLEQENVYLEWQSVSFKENVGRALPGEEATAGASLNTTISAKVYWLE